MKRKPTRLLKIKYFLLLLFAFEGNTQTLSWEFNLFPENGAQITRAGVVYNGNLYCVGQNTSGIKDKASFYKVSQNGISKLNVSLNTSPCCNAYAQDIVKAQGADAFWVSLRMDTFASVYDDYLYKVDTNGRVLKADKIPDPGFIYDKGVSLISMPDGGVLSVGYVERGISGEDVYLRRVNKNGDVIYSKQVIIKGHQRPLSASDLLNGSFIVSGVLGLKSFNYIFDYDGNLIDTSSTDIGQGLFASFSEIKQNKRIAVFGSGYHDGFKMELDQGIYSNPQIMGNGVISYNDFDSYRYLSLVLDSTWNYQIRYFDSVSGSIIWSDNITSIRNQFKALDGVIVSNEGSPSAYIIGRIAEGSNPNITDYWVGKYSFPVPFWIPDPCIINPPSAQMHWNLVGGILSCYDSSSSGLLFDDSIYSSSWSSNLYIDTVISGVYTAFWDTVSQKTAEITLFIENFYGCRDSVTYILDPTATGLSIEDELGFDLFPNPANDVLNISISNSIFSPQKRGSFTIVDMSGKKFQSYPFNGNFQSISLSDLPSGSYILQIQIGESKASKTFVKR